MIKRKGRKNEEAKVYEGESIQLEDACVRIFLLLAIERNLPGRIKHNPEAWLDQDRNNFPQARKRSYVWPEGYTGGTKSIPNDSPSLNS